jgi:putative endopeptidase
MRISIKLALAITASSLVFAAPAFAQSASGAMATAEMAQKTDMAAAKDGPQLGKYGFDDAGMDSSVKPGDDFYSFANAKWEKNIEIPADKSNYGMFTALYDLSKERVGKILDSAKDQKGSKIGDAYASYLDSATVEKLGMTPIKPWMNKIRAVKTRAQLEKLLPEASRNGVSSFFGGYVGQDDKNPENYIFQISQGGTGLRDRDMYLVQSEKLEANRVAYKAYLAKMLALAGEANNVARANAIFEMEKKIATIHWTREDSSDATKTYNKMTVAQLGKATPGMNIAMLLNAASPKIDSVIVSQPSAITGTAKIFGETNLQVLKDKMLVNSLASYSDVLPDAVANTTFAFYGTVMSGTPQREIRWKRGVSFAEGALGEEVGKEYAAKYFPPETKAAMDVLVKNVLGAMGRRIEGLEWMQPATKDKAKTKLANFTTKIGYPDKWRDYSGLKIVRGDLFGNALRSNQFDFDDGISKLGSPLRRWEWGMLPQTVNAYANFGMNEIVFPAAILQSPFFDPKADAAINYGGIGAVIGHEISHHFDDQGAKYDETGKLSDWWTPSDVAAFEKAGKALIAQYDKYEVFPGQFVKGEFTLGENIGDLAGLTIAYDAYKTSLNGKEAPVIDGMTGDQRFFLGWAQVWRRKVREAEARQRLLTDSHSPSPQRVSVVRNLDKWYDAFNPKPEDKLYLSKENRVRIW